MNQNFNIIIPSNRPEMASETKKCLHEFDCIIHDGNGYSSFSKLINDCILKADKEIVIIANDKVRPSSSHIKKMIYLLNKGFGLVGLYRFGFFGFTKNLIRTIGFFDERFIGGGYEDADFGKRCLEANIAIYESPETPYINNLKSSWNYSRAEIFNKQKWYQSNDTWNRLLPEEIYTYDLGEKTNEEKWMPFSSSMLSKSSLPSHLSLKIFNEKPIDLSQLKCSEIL